MRAAAASAAEIPNVWVFCVYGVFIANQCGSFVSIYGWGYRYVVVWAECAWVEPVRE